MYKNGEQVILYLGEDRRIYINNKPGKVLTAFSGRIFPNVKNGKNVIAITYVPDNFDDGIVLPPQGYEIQGI